MWYLITYFVSVFICCASYYELYSDKTKSSFLISEIEAEGGTKNILETIFSIVPFIPVLNTALALDFIIKKAL